MSVRLERYSGNPILSPVKEHQWESNAVMNASVILENGKFHMLYRSLDTRKKVFPSGKIFHHSYIGYAESKDGVHFTRQPKPFVKPEFEWESLGCEDPRITRIDGTHYIFYTAIGEGKETDLSVQVAGFSTNDFNNIEKLGLINLEGRSKAAALFPEQVNGKFVFLYTQNADRPNSTIYCVKIDAINTLFNAKEWAKVEKIPLLTPSTNAYRGPELGAVPIKTSKGWLLIYCPESSKREWFIGAALLDLENPSKVLGKTQEPILKPEADYELSGYTDNATFPSGAVIVENTLFVYYGGADSGVCLAKCKLDEILDSLT